ncbi:MAG: hypothetical protein Ct9H300mP10_05900 [Methanobacteriota archaeon]|nr:MAG: hypothetical protein Ct9H300mP10_05900 [Euryarchaeota archaeon]
MHNGFVNVDGEKMSKSMGNFWTIRDAFEHHEPLALRYALLSVPYRNPIDLTPEFLEDAATHFNRLVGAYGDSLSSDSESETDLSGASERFAAAMDDDFNTRAAMIEIQAVVSSANGSDVAVWLERHAGDVLGLLPPSEDVMAGLAQAIPPEQRWRTGSTRCWPSARARGIPRTGPAPTRSATRLLRWESL